MRSLLSALVLFFPLSTISAQWSTDPTVNTVLDKPGDQRAPLITTDGKGGAIVAWNEDNGIFANWVDKFGLRRWGNEGVRITPPERLAGLTNIISDGRGGAVIVWDDFTNAREVGFEVPRIIENAIFAQRVDDLGQLVWDAAGVGVRTKIDSTTVAGFNIITSDNNEFIVFWFEDRKHPYPQTGPYDFFAQKIGSGGELQWQSNGQLISVQGSLHTILFRIVPDNSGRFLLARRRDEDTRPIIERISSQGELLWPAGGVRLHVNGTFEMVPDGLGGAIIMGVGVPQRGRVERVDESGNLVWGNNGIVLKDTLSGFVFFDIIADGNHGAIILLSEGGGQNIFLQRVASDGRQLWQPGGVPLPKAGFLMSDNKGGVIIILSEIIEDSVRTFKQSVQKFDSLGIAKWEKEGTIYQVRQNDPGGSREYISDLRGGIILAWEEFDFQTSLDVVMQQVSRNGNLGDVITTVENASDPIRPSKYALLQNYPNPFNPETQIRFALEISGVVSLVIYDVTGRKVITLIDENLTAGEHQIIWDGKDETNNRVASGVYFYRFRVNDFQAVRKMAYIR